MLYLSILGRTDRPHEQLRSRRLPFSKHSTERRYLQKYTYTGKENGSNARRGNTEDNLALSPAGMGKSVPDKGFAGATWTMKEVESIITIHDRVENRFKCRLLTWVEFDHVGIGKSLLCLRTIVELLIDQAIGTNILPALPRAGHGLEILFKSLAMAVEYLLDFKQTKIPDVLLANIF